MENTPLKDRLFIIIELLEYTPGKDVTKTIIRKTDNNVTAVSFISDDAFTENVAAVNTYIQVLEGTIELVVNERPTTVESGNSITVLAHVRKQLIAKEAFKITSTVIKTIHD